MCKINPLVSIITPSFNQADYLEDTIKSVLRQDYPRIEYLVVDGGSSDGSVDIIRKYASEFTWWVSEPDKGQASAINKGMARAKGEIVAWLNSDDLYLPGAISRAVAEFEARPELGFVFGDAVTIDADGRPIKELIFPDWQFEDLIGFRIICQPAVFIARRYYEQVEGLEHIYHYMLDHHLWIKIASKAPIQHIPELLAAARHHQAAKNVAQAADFGRETLEVMEWMGKEPGLADSIKVNQRKVLGGAYRLNARYLMDGSQFGAAISSYGKAFINQPIYTAHHWHRIIYAFFGMLGFRNLAGLYTRYQDSQRPDFSAKTSLLDWPGLSLERLD